MQGRAMSRRAFLGWGALGAAALGAAALGLGRAFGGGQAMTTLVTFGDSILDCGRYNEHGVHPGALIVRNDDALFPEFRGRDLASRGPARLDHRAQDGATIANLPAQARGLRVEGPALAILTVGGNDLLQGL